MSGWGGKRPRAGRGFSSSSSQYKDTKKKQKTASAQHKDIRSFIQTTPKNSQAVVGGDSTVSQDVDQQSTHLYDVGKLPENLPFFQNGSYLTQGTSEQNFTCAVDAIEGMIEAILLSPAGKHWLEKNDQLVRSVNKILNWRMENQFGWNHSLRTELWDLLCNMFPSQFTPRGTIQATVDEAIEHLSKVDPLWILYQMECKHCHTSMGTVKHSFERPVFLSTLNVDSTDLEELLPELVCRYLKSIIGPLRLLKCDSCGGIGVKEPSQSKIDIYWPKILFLWLNILMHDKQNVKCGIKECLLIGRSSASYSLVSSIVHQPNHFFTISKLNGKFYNLDNLDSSPSATKNPHNSFRDAFLKKKSKSDASEIIPEQLSNRRNGSIQYLVYVTEDSHGDRPNFDDFLDLSLFLFGDSTSKKGENNVQIPEPDSPIKSPERVKMTDFNSNSPGTDDENPKGA